HSGETSVPWSLFWRSFQMVLTFASVAASCAKSRSALVATAILMTFLLAPVIAQRPPQAASASPWMNKDLSPDQRAEMVVEQMTLDEKIALAHGAGGFQGAGTRSNGGAGMIPGIPR